MTAISLPLPGNVLHTEEQVLEFDKIATFIGGNGSGKSSILKSIFDEKLKSASTLYQDYKIVCFSSGQNESYSERFARYLNTERTNKRALSLDCFYYDKSLAKLLIFLSTTGNQNGLVRRFLKQNSYIIESEYEEDNSTKISFDIKVDRAYTNLVEQAHKDESNGNSDVITNKAYHQTLSNFITTLVDDDYDFSEPLEQRTVQLDQNTISKVSFETDEHTSFDSKIMFFTQAADNNYFIVKNSFDIKFSKVAEGEDEKLLRLEDMSDGEYQLLFLYALVDLFDRENTLFLFDEADSHLHYKNIDHLWTTFNGISGKAITTTHLLDSISKSGIERLKVVENGEIKTGEKISYLASRLTELSEINSTQLKAMSLAKNIVFMDCEDDWIIFKLLAIRKLAENQNEAAQISQFLNKFVVIKQESGFEKNSQVFADKKLMRLANFVSYLEGHPHNTKNVYMICDRDEFPLTNIGTAKCALLVQQNGIQKFNKNNLISHLLSWKRREIKHYLVCPSALNESNDALNESLDLGVKTKLQDGQTGDYSTEGNYNGKLASVESGIIKEIIDPYVKNETGFCVNRTQSFVNSIPKAEISEDIVNLYNYLVITNE
ncbi:ATP-binding protein [Pseudoalteromonas sp. MMG013]|uniref:AAA family ATPase n=1 Tax=Pseudoalteromonas sp. MMG013 TaxID=2822687 RepID=UPI001B37D406|nr:AAA family ATPase [Pseudoalteromonas sp. MMG013]MBQ4864707.1 ATP-binding protein [Pseudoalteromonas sp. MMG013]